MSEFRIPPGALVDNRTDEQRFLDALVFELDAVEVREPPYDPRQLFAAASRRRAATFHRRERPGAAPLPGEGSETLRRLSRH